MQFSFSSLLEGISLYHFLVCIWAFLRGDLTIQLWQILKTFKRSWKRFPSLSWPPWWNFSPPNVPLGGWMQVSVRRRNWLESFWLGNSFYPSWTLLFLAVSMGAQFGVASLLCVPGFSLKKQKLQGSLGLPWWSKELFLGETLRS